MRKNWFGKAALGFALLVGITVSTPHDVHAERAGNGLQWKKADGRLAKNEWIRIDGKEYRFGADGKMLHRGFAETDCGRMYFDKNGIYRKNRWSPDGMSYLKSNGVQARNELLTIGKNRYFFDRNGKKAVNTVREIGGKQYWFRGDGKMARNVRIKGKKVDVRFDAAGQVVKVGGTGGYWKEVNGKRMFSNGLFFMKSSWLDWKGERYRLSSKGTACTGKSRIYGKQYLFSETGALLKGWQKIGNKTYFASTKDGRLTTGWLHRKNSYYFHSKTGEMKHGWATLGTKRCFFDYETGRYLKSGKAIRQSEERRSRKLKEEADRKRRKAEAERKRKAEAEKRRKAEEAKRRKAEREKRQAAKVYRAAVAQLGMRRDCVTMVANSLKSVNINMKAWPVEYLKLGHTVQSRDAVPGDLIYYRNAGLGMAHIAVYAGAGQAIHGGWNGYLTVRASTLPQYNPVFIRVRA